MQRVRPLEEHVKRIREDIQIWIKARPLTSIIVTIVATALLLPAFQAIYQGAVSAVFFDDTWPWLVASQKVPRLVAVSGWFLFAVTLIGLVIVLWVASIRLAAAHSSLEEAHRQAAQQSPHGMRVRMTNMEAERQDLQAQRDVLGEFLELSMNSLTMVTKIAPELQRNPRHVDEKVRLLVRSVIAHTAKMCGRAPRTSLYLPSEVEPDYLTIFESIGLDRDSIESAKWYIGQGNDPPRRAGKAPRGTRSAPPMEVLPAPRGTAGTVFIHKKPLVHHINPQTLRAEEGDDYVPSPTDRHVCPYESFVSMPLLDTDRCLGVLCIDSPDRDTFDGDPRFTVLQPAARMLVQLLLMRQELRKMLSQSEVDLPVS
jgi:hypothetical protein